MYEAIDLVPVRENNHDSQPTYNNVAGSISNVIPCPSAVSSINLDGKSEPILNVKRLIQQVSKTDASVLILGKSGTGKEVAARAIHDASLRAKKPFIPVNCGAIPHDLLESELFGHEKGAFTGAITSRVGRFELAEGGTLFLDEIGDMRLDMQVKLLRVLQERTFERVGGTRTHHANVRIIAATHQNLEVLIEKNQFREDLFYRINVFPIDMPSLTSRRSDIPGLIQVLLNEAPAKPVFSLTPEAMQCIVNYDWPGNVRQLANFVERMRIVFPDQLIDLSKIPEKYKSNKNMDNPLPTSNKENIMENFTNEPRQIDDIDTIQLPSDGIDLKAHLTAIEQKYIDLALQRTNGVVAHAAKLLGLGRTTLVEKLRRYSIDKAA